jgi:hypothetical protein
MKFSTQSCRAIEHAYIRAMPQKTNGRKQPKPAAERRAIQNMEAAEAWRDYFAAIEGEHEKTARLRAQRLGIVRAKGSRKQSKR